MFARPSPKTPRPARGSTLIVVLLISIVLFLLGIAFSSYIAMEYKLVGDTEVSAETFYLADAGARYMQGAMGDSTNPLFYNNGTAGTNLFSAWSTAVVKTFVPPLIPHGYSGQFSVSKDPDFPTNPKSSANLTINGKTYQYIYYLVSTGKVTRDIGTGTETLGNRTIKFQVATVDQVDKDASAQNSGSVDRTNIIYRWKEAFR